MDRQPVRAIVCAWGKHYVDQLLTYALPSLLAPGNLPALSKVFDCTLVIVTEEQLFDYVNSHPLLRRARSICAVRLIPLDDVLGEPWQYGISLAYALFRGFADLGAAMTETYLLFLNADFVLADGCYARLIPYMQRGDRALLSPSYCTVEEEVVPALNAIRKDGDGVLAIPPRQLAQTIIKHRHNTIRAKTLSQNAIHFQYMDQAYWQVDEDTIIGHQMPICLVAMRPERVLKDINTFWDWGITYEFCPSKKLTVLGDSDDFLMLELRRENTHLDLVRLGPTTPAAAGTFMRGYLTRYQLDNVCFPLTLHAKSIPGDIEESRSKLREFVEGVRDYYDSTQLPDHRNHPQWIYHKTYLLRHLEIKHLRRQADRLDHEHAQEHARIGKTKDSVHWLLNAELVRRRRAETIAAHATGSAPATDNGATATLPIVGSLVAAAGEFERHRRSVERHFDNVAKQLSARHDAVTKVLRIRLTELEQNAPVTDDIFGYCALDVGDGSEAAAAGLTGRLRRRAQRYLFGSIPHTRFGHPLHPIYKDIAIALDRADHAGSDILFVGSKHGLASRVPAGRRNRRLRISSAGLLRPALTSTFDRGWCGLCVIELGQADFPQIRKLHSAVLPYMRPGGRIVMFWVNHTCERGEQLQQALVRCALMEYEGARVRFVSPVWGWGGLDLLQLSGRRRAMPLARRLLTLMAATAELSIRRLIARVRKETRAVRGNCLGLVIEIDTAPQPYEAVHVGRTEMPIAPARLGGMEPA